MDATEKAGKITRDLGDCDFWESHIRSYVIL